MYIVLINNRIVTLDLCHFFHSAFKGLTGEHKQHKLFTAALKQYHIAVVFIMK